MPTAKKKEVVPIVRPPEINLPNEERGLLAGRARGELGKWEMGRHFNNISMYALFKDAGCATLEEYVVKALKNEPSTATLEQYAVVADNFGAEQAQEFTCHKLSHLISYAKTVGIDDLSKPGEVQVVVPRADGKTEVKAFRDCTVTEVEAALARNKGPRGEVDEAMADEAEHLGAALAEFFGEESHVQVNVTQRGRGSVARIDNLQVAEMARLREMLNRA